MKLFLHKLMHWEYWPFGVVYFPVFFLWAYYSLRSGTFFFFNAANPGIKNGGFMSESKKEIHDLIPQKWCPETILIKPADNPIDKLKETSLNFPLIAKPDIGLRGSGVRKIVSNEALADYHAKADFDYLLQDLIPYSNEVGIFYVRYPSEKNGRITGIVSKEFLIVTGDGKSTIRELLKLDPRHEMQISSIGREHGKNLEKVPESGQKINLVPYGNHARGAKFLDVSHLMNDNLTSTINDICCNIPGFYFGRLDIMYDSFDDLAIGKNFQIVEVNGSASEPTHIYDPKHSIFFAWKELFRHIRYMYEIAKENHKLGIPYLSRREGITQYKIHLAQSRKIVDF